MADLQVLQAGPPLACRRETVPVPELGGAVIVRGLTCSEQFAVEALRMQATARQRAAAREQAERARPGPDGKPAPELDAADLPPLDWGEAVAYGAHMVHAVAHAVTAANGMALYTAQDWDEAVGSTYPDLIPRLYQVVERLSGMNVEDVRKN